MSKSLNDLDLAEKNELETHEESIEDDSLSDVVSLDTSYSNDGLGLDEAHEFTKKYLPKAITYFDKDVENIFKKECRGKCSDVVKRKNICYAFHILTCSYIENVKKFMKHMQCTGDCNCLGKKRKNK